jgi:hypothetical protein
VRTDALALPVVCERSLLLSHGSRPHVLLLGVYQLPPQSAHLALEVCQLGFHFNTPAFFLRPRSVAHG